MGKGGRTRGKRPLPSGKEPGSLGEIAEQKPKAQGKQTRGPQGPGWQLADFGKPALHGLGKEDIGNRFQNKDETKHGNKKFHGGTLPAAQRFFKARISARELHETLPLRQQPDAPCPYTPTRRDNPLFFLRVFRGEKIQRRLGPPEKRWVQDEKQKCILSHHDNP